MKKHFYILLLFIIIFRFNGLAQQFPGFINPGLEGIPQFSTVPPNWTACLGTPDTEPEPGYTRVPVPSEGKTFLGFWTTESAQQILCEPLKKGITYAFTLDWILDKWSYFPGEALGLKIYGGNSNCDETELLVASSSFCSDTLSWKSVTFTFTPTADYTSLLFHPYSADTTGYFYIDNIRPANPSPVSITSDTTICVGNSLNLIATGGTSYKWSPGGETTSSITVSPTSTTTYTVTITTGCTTTTRTVILTVKNNCFTTTAIGGNVCKGSCLNLNATADGGTGPYTYSWQPGNLTDASPKVCPLINTTYTLTLTDKNGKRATDTALVTVDSVFFTIAAPAVCKGSTGVLTASNNNLMYLWSTGQTGVSITVHPDVTITYTVTGTNSIGCKNSKTVVLTVKSNPIITATGANVCPSDSAQLSATGADSYSWSPTSTLINSLSANPIAFPSVTTTYTVIGTYSAGCSDTTTAIVTVSNTFATTISADTSICGGSSVQLLASGGKKYIWIPAIGLSDPTIANPIASPAITTTYSVTISSGNCIDTKKVVVTVNARPIVTATSAIICEKEKAVLTSSGASDYQWITPTGILTGSSVNVSPDKSTTYTVIGMDKGCADTVEVSVTVNPLPVIQVSDTMICVGVKTTIYAKGADNYTWLGPNGTILSNTSSLTISPTTTTSYTVVGTDSNGCKNTKTGTVTVNAIPDVVANGGVVCLGDEFKLEAHGNAFFYVWTASDSSKLPNKALVIVVPTTNTTYTVTGTTKYCLDTAIAHVNVNLPPIITVNDGTICEGNQITLTATGGVKYVWSTGATTNSITVSPKTTSTYIVTGIKDNCFHKLATTVQVNKKPKGLFSMSPKELTEYEPTVSLNNLSVGANLKYEWNLGDINNPNVFFRSKDLNYTYFQPDTYNICLKVTDSVTTCVDSTCNTIIYKPQFNLYVPNAFTPNQDDLNETFQPKGRNIIEFNIIIFDRWGNEIFESNDLNKGWDATVNGNVAPQGIYVWKIICKDVLKKQHQYTGHVTLVKY